MNQPKQANKAAIISRLKKLESKSKDFIEQNQDIITEVDAAINKIDAALPQVLGLEASEQEMDEIAQMATDGYKTLMDLGMNVETRHAAEVFGAASNMLGHALTAKKNKLEKKLKMIELQLKKQRLDLQSQQLGNQAGVIPAEPGAAMVIDRNQLVADMLKKMEKNK